jgi:hypothetical protein
MQFEIRSFGNGGPTWEQHDSDQRDDQIIDVTAK